MTGRPGWSQVLDGMERRLEVAERFLAGEEVHLDHFVMPDGLGPIPADSAGRAGAILAATADIEQRLAEEMQRVAGQISATVAAARSPRPRPAPSFFDRPA